MKILLRIRSPLLTPEVQVTEERSLLVDPWPSMPAAPSALSQQVPVAVDIKTDVQEDSVLEGQRSDVSTASVSLSNPLFAGITEQEKRDPHSADLLDSNDVLEAEIQLAEQQLAGCSASDEDELFACQLRLQLLRGKLQILVYNVQNETLTLEDYLAGLRKRVARDQVLAVYFRTVGDAESMAHALRLLRRIRIMNEEIKNAAASADDDPVS